MFNETMLSAIWKDTVRRWRSWREWRAIQRRARRQAKLRAREEYGSSRLQP